MSCFNIDKNLTEVDKSRMILLQVHLQKPCYDFLILQMIWFTKSLTRTSWEQLELAIQVIHRIIQSIEATGGVYKGQGRNQH